MPKATYQIPGALIVASDSYPIKLEAATMRSPINTIKHPLFWCFFNGIFVYLYENNAVVTITPLFRNA